MKRRTLPATTTTAPSDPAVPPIRVLIADDHPGFRAGVRARLEREPDIAVVGEAADGHEALALARTAGADVLLLDLEMPGRNGVEVMAEVARGPGAPAVLVLSAYDDEPYIFTVLERGAAGYLTKHEPLATLVEAVRGVARGELGWLSRKIAAALLRRERGDAAGVHVEHAPPDAALEAGLSEREREVLALVAQGLGNSAVAERLFISESTVKKHINAIYDKVGVPTRAAAVAWAWRHRLVDAHAGQTVGDGRTPR
jgi:DNA-binding NarL/FixJ family response regulator